MSAMLCFWKIQGKQYIETGLSNYDLLSVEKNRYAFVTDRIFLCKKVFCKNTVIDSGSYKEFPAEYTLPFCNSVL